MKRTTLIFAVCAVFRAVVATISTPETMQDEASSVSLLRGNSRRLQTTVKVGTCSGATYTSIAAAVNDAASSGVTVWLCRGTFYEDSIVIAEDKEIEIVGRGKSLTIIKANQGVRYMVNALPGSSLTLRALQLDGRNNMAETTATHEIIAGLSCDKCTADLNNVRMVNLNTYTSTPTASYGIFARDWTANAGNSITVRNSRIIAPTAGGIVVDGAGMSGTIETTNIDGNGNVMYPAAGIQFSRGATGSARNNRIIDYKSGISTLASGISTICSTVTIEQNDLDDNDIGVLVVSSSNVVVHDNDIDRSRIGILLELQSATCPPFRLASNTVTSNSIYDSIEDGIRVLETHSGDIENNSVRDNTVDLSAANGLAVFSGDQDEYSGNSFSNSGNSGIYVDDVYGCSFTNNAISNSGQEAIEIASSWNGYYNGNTDSDSPFQTNVAVGSNNNGNNI